MRRPSSRVHPVCLVHGVRAVGEYPASWHSADRLTANRIGLPPRRDCPTASRSLRHLEPADGLLEEFAKDLKDEVPFQPWAKALYDERAAGKFWREEPDANCLPQGVPKVLLAPAPWQIVQTPKVVFFIHEAFNLWWQAFMDGRWFVPHPDVAPPAAWILHGHMGRRHAGRRERRLQRQGLARPAGQAVD